MNKIEQNAYIRRLVQVRRHSALEGSGPRSLGKTRDTGTGSDGRRRSAAPMGGGVFSAFVGEQIVYPSIFFIWRALKLKHGPLFPTRTGDGGVPSGRP